MKRHEKGLLAGLGIYALLYIAFWIAVLVVAIHFISKVW